MSKIRKKVKKLKKNLPKTRPKIVAKVEKESIPKLKELIVADSSDYYSNTAWIENQDKELRVHLILALISISTVTMLANCN